MQLKVEIVFVLHIVQFWIEDVNPMKIKLLKLSKGLPENYKRTKKDRERETEKYNGRTKIKKEKENCRRMKVCLSWISWLLLLGGGSDTAEEQKGKCYDLRIQNDKMNINGLSGNKSISWSGSLMCTTQTYATHT